MVKLARAIPIVRLLKEAIVLQPRCALSRERRDPAGRGKGSVAEKAKEQASQLGEAAFSGAGNIAAATGLVKKEEFPADLKAEEVAQEAVEEPLVEPLLEPEGESYEESPQEEYQEYEPEA